MTIYEVRFEDGYPVPAQYRKTFAGAQKLRRQEEKAWLILKLELPVLTKPLMMDLLNVPEVMMSQRNWVESEVVWKKDTTGLAERKQQQEVKNAGKTK